MFVLPSSFAEEFRAGNAAKLSKKADLRKEPRVGSPVVGRLPRGTILTLTGETQGRFVKVEVELVDGQATGWIAETAIEQNKEVSEKKTDELDSEFEEVTNPVPRKKRRRAAVPTDESVLLSREPSFNYGIFAGGNYGITNTQFNENIYTGIGYQAGGFFSFFLGNQFTLGAELGYTKVQGTAIDLTQAGYGLLDIGVIFEYMPDRFRLFAVAQYSMGLGLSDIPRVIALVGPADVSGVWVKGGAGYALPLSEFSNLVFKAFYGISFTRLPVGFQTIGTTVGLEFRG